MNRIIVLAGGLLIAVLGVSCVSSDSGGNNRNMSLTNTASLQFWSIHPLDKEDPKHTPFDLRPDLRDAYVDGFRTGWEIIRNVPYSSSLVAPPDRYSQPRLTLQVWYDGINDGKWAVFCIVNPTNSIKTGLLKLPDKTPYDSSTEQHNAYLAGFAVGWSNVQNGRSQSAAYPADIDASSKAFIDIWFEGFVMGKECAYKEYLNELSEKKSD